MARRVKAISACFHGDRPLRPLLALVNNYVKALRFVLFWLTENVKNPEEKKVKAKNKKAKNIYKKLFT